MSETTTTIKTRKCTHCFAGREPIDGHSVEELRAEMIAQARAREPRPEFAAKLRAAEERNRAGRER